jgi:hypothetical protein
MYLKTLSIFSLVITSTILLTASLAAAKVTVADSVREFSSTQGQYDWYYGYYDKSNDGDGTYDPSTDFQQMTEFGQFGNVWSVKWGTYWTLLSRDAHHPNAVITSGGHSPVEHWAIRRWVSEVPGTITISGTLAKRNTIAGDGVSGHILVDGLEAWSQSIVFNDSVGVDYTIGVPVNIGSSVDFIISPRRTDWADEAKFTATIEYDPLSAQSVDMNISTQPSSLIADGKSTSQVTVSLADKDRNPVTDETVTLSTTLGQVTRLAPHRGNGVYVGIFTASPTPGTATITTRISSGKSATAIITLTPQVISPIRSTLVTDKKQAIANSVDEVTVTIYVKDTSGKPISGKSVAIAVSGTGNTITPQTAETSALGEATIKIRSTKAELKTVTATVGEEQIELNASATLQFVPGPVAKISISANPATLWADGESESTLKITVLDAQNNPMSEQKPQIQISPKLGQVSQITDNSDGTYTATYTAPQDVEEITSVTVSASIAGKSDSVVLSIRHAEVLIAEISPESIKIGERATVTGEMFPKSSTMITLTFTHGGASTTESITTDADGKFNHIFTPNRAGNWQAIARWEGDAKHKPVQSEPMTFTVQKGEIEITLNPPENLFSLAVGDTVSLSGEMTPNPGVVDLSVVITNPDGTEKTLPIQTDNSGTFQFQFKADLSGTWEIQARFAGDVDYLAKQATLSLPIGTQLGRAIIVAGGPDHTGNNSLWTITHELCNDVYDKLRERGYSRQMIHYLSPTPFEDVDGDKRNDVSNSPTIENLKQAITQLPLAFFKRNPNAQLVLYITGHGFEDQFQLADEREIVTANQLNQWLSTLQRQTGLKKILVILDGSRSGSFIDDLAAEGRTIITSTDSSRTVNFGSRGGESFSQFFFQRLALGHSIAESFSDAEEASFKRPAHLRPKPQIDSDGNGIANEETDRAIASQLHVGLDVKPGTTIPTIDEVTPPQEIEDTKTTQIWAEVSTVQGVTEVWAVIISPNYQPPTNDEGSSWLQFPVVFLKANDAEKRYFGSYDGFDRPGEYTIIIYAEDRVGNVSVPQQTTVTVRLTVASLLPTTWGNLKTALLSNYPNPFNPETWMPYQLAEAAEVVVVIYDLNGAVVRTLDLGVQPAGVYVEQEQAAHWDGTNDFGEQVSSGIYFYTLKAGNFTATRRMILIK